MLTYNLDGNKYLSLYKSIRKDILSGKLKKGQKLPSKRALAQNLSVSVITVQTAYAQLLAEGYIYSAERRGYFVSEIEAGFYGARRVQPVPPENKQTFAIDFVNGADGAFPFSVWAKLMRGVLSDCGEHLLRRVPCDGDYALKRAVCDYLYRARGIEADPRYVVIGAGAEYLYGIIVRLLGRDTVFAVENPGYKNISSAYKLYGAECVYISVGEEGADCAEAERSRAGVLHISPSHQFPTGAVTPARSRARLISWADACGKYIIEDDYDSEFRLAGKPLQSMYSLNPDRVIYMNTFSKSLAPSMRMGYMILPPALYERYISLFNESSCAVPLFEQKTLASMLDGGHFERHIQRLKNRYRAVRSTLAVKAGELGKRCVLHDTGSGLHLLAQFPYAPNEEYIKAKALDMGINVKCVSDYLLAPAKTLEKCAVINYAGVSKESIFKIVF